jgi:hypothetical protein
VRAWPAQCGGSRTFKQLPVSAPTSPQLDADAVAQSAPARSHHIGTEAASLRYASSCEPCKTDALRCTARRRMMRASGSRATATRVEQLTLIGLPLPDAGCERFAVCFLDGPAVVLNDAGCWPGSFVPSFPQPS